MSAPADVIAAAPAAAAAAAAPAAIVTPAAARAAAREAEILALNAAAKADIEAIGQPQAKDVSPRDIVSPINEALLPSGGSTKVDTPWDGATSTFTIHQRNLLAVIGNDRLGCCSAFTRQLLDLHQSDVIGLDVYANDHCPALTKARCAQMTRTQKAAISTGARTLFSTILLSIDSSVREHTCTDAGDFDFDPDRLWAAVCKHAQGPFVQTTGAAMMRRFYGLEWNSTNATIVGQVDDNFTVIQELLRTSEAVNTTGCTISVEGALVKMIAIMPEGLRIHERTHNGYTTVVVLRDEMRRDAARLDASAARGLRSFAAREVEHKELEAKITKLERLLSSNGGGRSNDTDRGRSRGNGDGKNGRHQFTNEQMMDKDCRPPTGVPWKFTHFCSVHGHSTTHSDDRCFVLHPELKPADRN